MSNDSASPHPRARIRYRTPAPAEGPASPASAVSGEPSGGADAGASSPQPTTAHPVGYKRPPLHGRIKPGEIRNPHGRPKGSKNTATLAKEELD